MKIAQITAGTGNFYCGACLRDAALVKGLRALGHDAWMLPLYLPTVEEETPTTRGEVFLGGINAFLQQKLALFRRTPRFLDRWFDRPGLLRFAARFSGMTRADDLGAMTCAALEGLEGPQRKEVERLLTHLAEQEKPDVVILSNVLLLGFAPALRSRLGVPVICTLQGEDSFLDHLPAPWCDRAWDALRARVADVDAFIGVSAYYADVMRERMRIPQDKVHVVHNGIALDDYADHSRDAAEPVIGYLSQLIRNKGLHTLIDAYLLLRERGTVPGVRLDIAGSTVPGGEAFLAEQRAKVAACGADVRIRENVSRAEKLDLLHRVRVFSVPATYGESFGLYVIEALAAGAPVVLPRHAAFPELVSLTGGGVLCEPDDPAALADALEALLLDPARADALGAAGREAVQRDFSAEAMTRTFAAVLERVGAARAS